MYIDIAIIVIVALGALIGLWKGFFKTLISFFGWFMSFLIAMLITKPIAEALLDVGKIRSLVLGTDGWSFYSWILAKLPADLDVGGFLGVLLKPILKIAGASATNVALLLANGMFNVIVCIALFLLIRLFLLLFTMFANAMTRGKFLGALNRLLGFLLGAVKGTALVALVMVVFTFVMGLSFMSPVREQIDKSVIAQPMYTQVSRLTDKFLAGNSKTLQKLRILAGVDKEEGEQEPSPACGVYTSVQDDDTTFSIELKEDGTFVLQSGGDPRAGTYELNGEAITLHFDDEEQPTLGTVNVQDGWMLIDGVYLGKPDAVLPAPEQKWDVAGIYTCTDDATGVTYTLTLRDGEITLLADNEITPHKGRYDFYEDLLNVSLDGDHYVCAVTETTIELQGKVFVKQSVQGDNFEIV
ncbi:MAG: CvpA family protein [Clostridia bacterium]|nr:CvpA family protein [Clostridia bacterium]